MAADPYRRRGWLKYCIRIRLQGERVTLASGLPKKARKRVTLALAHFLFFTWSCLQGS